MKFDFNFLYLSGYVFTVIQMNINTEQVKEKSRQVFESWFHIFAAGQIEIENKERLFEYFYSGFLAGTRFSPGDSKNKCSNIIYDDINRNLDL